MVSICNTCVCNVQTWQGFIIMKKISNITLHNINNYGSVYQALATEYIFEQLGYTCETADFTRETAIQDDIKVILSNKEYSFTYRLKLLMLQPSFKRNFEVFDKFRKKWLHLSPIKYIGDKSIESNPPIADIYCTGSDQVWNCKIQKGVPGPYLLNYAPEDAKKIAFAASIGVNKIEGRYLDTYKKLLSRYSAISVRETSAVELLGSIGFKSTLVLDPTIVAGREFWDKVASSRLIKEDYVLIYQMGSDSKFASYAKKYAKRHNLRLIRICNDYFKVILPGEHIMFPSPEDMLSLFKYSSCTITNSFHATAFSLIYERQLVVVLPEYATRVVSLLELVGIKDKVLLKNYNDYNIGQESLEYKTINKIIAEKRDSSITFLKNALND